MSLAESACYTLINVSDQEPYNEMQIKLDLGELEQSEIHPVMSRKFQLFC